MSKKRKCHNCGRECEVTKCSCGAEDWQCECGYGGGHTCEKRLKETKMLVDREAEIVGTILELKQQLAEKDKQVEKVEKEKELDNIFWKQECDSLQKTLAEKDKEIERLKANQTPTRKRLTPKNWDKYNLADKLRYRNRQVREALIRFSNMNEMEEVLRSQLKDQRHQICEEFRKNSIFSGLIDYDDEIGVYTIKKDILDQIEKGEQNGRN